jgi:uncharacterized protein YbaR (Trm112 family)
VKIEAIEEPLLLAPSLVEAHRLHHHELQGRDREEAFPLTTGLPHLMPDGNTLYFSRVVVTSYDVASQ